MRPLLVWSEWRDLNSRPYGPEPYALPNCATPRLFLIAYEIYNNLRIFATTLRQLSQKIIILSDFEQNHLQIDKRCYIIICAMEIGVVVALGPLTPTV